MDEYIVSPTETVVGILIAIVFVVMVLYIAFGQITVRKLRKNPETKNELCCGQGNIRLINYSDPFDCWKHVSRSDSFHIGQGFILTSDVTHHILLI